MDLIFGLACDGRVYPDFPGDGAGAFDAAVVGPAGLLDILELALGLTAPQVSQAARTAAYAARLRSASADLPPPFFARSFAADPWATARLLLAWRDELIAGGWDRQPIGSPRLDQLARLEDRSADMPLGEAERLWAVSEALACRPNIPIRSISVVEPRDFLTPVWRAVIDAIAACGASLTFAATTPEAPDGDLAHAQKFLAGGELRPLAGDGSVAIVGGDTAIMCAEAVAEWLAAGDEASLNGTVVLCRDGDTALLDHAFEARGLPRLGISTRSPFRGALQVLQLAFATAWQPFDASSLLDLMMLPKPPVSRKAARRLARALAKEPGIGGPEWAKAWAKVEADLATRFANAANPTQETDRRLSQLKAWTRVGLYDRAQGIPAPEARSIALRVAEWAVAADGGRPDALLLAVAGAARSLVAAIDGLGQERLPALLLERMIELVLADGASHPDRVATAGGLRGVRSPGAIWGPAQRVIWWGFGGPGERPPVSPWSQAELTMLAQRGCHLESAEAAAARIGFDYARPVHMARAQIVFVRPATMGSAASTSHPLAHQLAPLLSPAASKIACQAETLLSAPSATIAHRLIARRTLPLIACPQPQRHWTLPVSVAERLSGRTESASSFERLMGCQLRWVMHDVLRLSPGRIAEMPRIDQLIGTLAHDVARRVFRPGPIADDDWLKPGITSAFEAAVQAIGTPLLLPEHAGELALARHLVPSALLDVARMLRRDGMEVEETEADRTLALGDGDAVQGRMDLLVRDSAGRLGVIDFKWTTSRKSRSVEVAEGRAIQLATYAALAGPGAATAAYYLLRQRRLIGPPDGFFAEADSATDRGLKQTWLDLLTSWRAWSGLAGQGTGLATGLHETAEGYPASLPFAPTPNPCRYCEFTTLCRVPQEVR
ncbi:PD-(D/E)XK nuclease family protein [Alsobacter sp. SYSU BS001988]